MEIGKKLKIIREAAGMNQAEVAEKAGISQGYYKAKLQSIIREIRVFKDRFAIEFQG